MEILARLEESRFQYDLIKQLSECSLEDLDKWTTILKQWSASSAELVLGELQRRLRLIERMQQLVEDPEADELHQLQPLFERGLWIFGTEYEADANRLWIAGGPTGQVKVLDASTGALLQTYTFSPAGFLNDLVVTDDAVYVTDSSFEIRGSRGWPS